MELFCFSLLQIFMVVVSIVWCIVISEYSDYWQSTSIVSQTLVSDPTINTSGGYCTNGKLYLSTNVASHIMEVMPVDQTS